MCTSLPQDEHLDVSNMSSTLQLNQNINVKSVRFVGSYYLEVGDLVYSKKANQSTWLIM